VIPAFVLNDALRWAKKRNAEVFVFADDEEPTGYGLATEFDANTYYLGQTAVCVVQPDGEVET
jgi:hypothetical protein